MNYVKKSRRVLVLSIAIFAKMSHKFKCGATNKAHDILSKWPKIGILEQKKYDIIRAVKR